MKEAQPPTIKRSPNEPKLEIGDTVLLKHGVVGVVLARYTPSGGGRNQVHYIVEVEPTTERGKH